MADLTLSTCPKCGLKNRLHEVHIGSSIKHECISCGYIMVWGPRMDTSEIRQLNIERPPTHGYTRA